MTAHGHISLIRDALDVLCRVIISFISNMFTIFSVCLWCVKIENVVVPSKKMVHSTNKTDHLGKGYHIPDLLNRDYTNFPPTSLPSVLRPRCCSHRRGCELGETCGRWAGNFVEEAYQQWFHDEPFCNRYQQHSNGRLVSKGGVLKK